MSEEVGDMLARLLHESDSRSEAIELLHRGLVERGLLSKVTLHRYQCKRGCPPLAIVFRAGSHTLCAASDYRYSPGMNQAKSVEAARAKNTLDGDRWWPSHVYDVDELATWGADAGMSIACRHHTSTLLAQDVLKTVHTVTPGRPAKPTLL